MDWNLAIEKNREALKRILAALVAMAGLDTRGQFTFFPREGALSQGFALAEKSKLSPAPTLPRHLHTAVLRLLRPAESAVRRLIIVAARGLVVTPPLPSRLRKANPAPTILRSGVGTGVLMPRALPGTVYFFPRNGAAGSGTDISGKKVNCPLRSTTRPPTLPLFDRLPRWESRPRPVARGVPRISVPGFTTPFPIPPSPSPDDLLDATRLGQRLAALAAALDDLPRQAKRFAHWQARRDAAGAQNKEHRDTTAAQTAQPLPHRRRKPQRLWPLRPGRPPGWRRKPGHELHEILKDLHGLAFDVLERRDTS